MRTYVLSTRYGVQMEKPKCFRCRKDAEAALRKIILDNLRLVIYDVIDDDDLEDEIDFNIEKDDDKLLEFALEQGYVESNDCKDSNGNDMINTVCIGDDWTECRIDLVGIKEKQKPVKKRRNLRKEIYEYLDDCFYCSDYDQAVEDIMEKWHLSQDEANSYVWNWTTASKHTV